MIGLIISTKRIANEADYNELCVYSQEYSCCTATYMGPVIQKFHFSIHMSCTTYAIFTVNFSMATCTTSVVAKM